MRPWWFEADLASVVQRKQAVLRQSRTLALALQGAAAARYNLVAGDLRDPAALELALRSAGLDPRCVPIYYVFVCAWAELAHPPRGVAAPRWC